MSLGPRWFNPEEKEKRKAQYPHYTAEEWLDALRHYWSTVWPIGEEAATWLRDNKTADQIFEDYGYKVVDLFARITGDPKAQSIAAERYALAKTLADEVGLKNEKQTQEIEELRQHIAAANKRLEETQDQLTHLEKSFTRSQEQADATEYERETKSAIKLIETQCRFVAGGAYLGSLATLGLIWIWLTWKPWLAGADLKQLVGNLIAVVAVGLPLPGFIATLWIEGNLTDRYKKRTDSS